MRAFRGRREDARLVTGRGSFTDDWSCLNQAFGCFVRSDRPHAEIVRVDAEPARALPGVLAVYTGDDIARAGFASPKPLAHFTGRDGTGLKVPPRPMLAASRVRYVGEAVALVVAENQAAAIDAADHVSIEYRDLPVVIDPAEALGEDAPQLHEAVPGNLAMEFEYGDAGATEAAFARAAFVAEVSLEAQRIAAVPMEPKACLVAPNPSGGTFDIYVPNQGAAQIQQDLARIAGIDHSRIRVRARDVGGAFGVRNEAYPEYLAVFLAARELGRPVKWNGTRAESMLSDHHGRGARLHGALALDQEGNFLGMRIEWLVDLGAYCSNAGPLINTVGPRSMATGLYRIPAVHGLHRLAFTNTTPTTAYRGAGRPNAAYLSERLVDEAARISGIDRVALRRRNLLPKEAFPYETPTGSTYDSADPAALLDEALEAADWAGFSVRRREAAAAGRLRGIGCALFIEPSGGSLRDQAAIRFDGDGRPLLYTRAGPSGQGHETAFPEVVGGILGIDPDEITLRPGDPDGPVLAGTGSFGSRSLVVHGAGLVVAAREVIEKGRTLAASELEAGEGDIDFTAGRYRVRGTDLSIGLVELAARHAGSEKHPLDATAEIAGPPAFPSGAHVAEVEIDPETGEVRIVRYTAVDDCGTIINPVLVEGQLQGGLMQGFGQVLGEACIYAADSGQLLTGTLVDYFMPRAGDLPELILRDSGVPSPTNPLGAKGVGEAGTTGSIPSLANAVLDALGPLGIHRLDTPFTPARIWEAIAASPVS